MDGRVNNLVNSDTYSDDMLLAVGVGIYIYMMSVMGDDGVWIL